MSENKNLKTMFFLGILILISVFSNPDQDIHVNEIKELMYSEMNLKEELNKHSSNEWEAAGAALGLSLGMSMIDKVVENMVSVDNYVIFSITNLKFDGESEVVGIGLFGNVFIFGELKSHFKNKF